MNTMKSNVISPILNRKSELAFDPKPIDTSSIELLFESARWAPSSYNEQPWRFYYVSRNDEDTFNKALEILAEGNSEWAKNSSLLVFSTAKTHLTLNGKDNGYALHDTGMATANILIQAEGMGLASHPMGGFSKEKAANLLNLPSDFIPVAVIAIGYSGDQENLSEANKKRLKQPRSRKAIEEIAIKL
jgi:nitroreductase